MGILLYSKAENASVGLSPVLLNGIQEHYRSYRATGHYLYIDGPSQEVISHDAQKILELEGFRLAEPEEQNAYFAPLPINVVEEGAVIPPVEEPKRLYRKRG